jgi:hypothetical protein
MLPTNLLNQSGRASKSSNVPLPVDATANNNNNNNNLDGLISRQTGAASASLHQIMWKGIKERCNDPLWKR